MTHENAPESTESDAGPESGPVSDGEAQDAREARYAEAIDRCAVTGSPELLRDIIDAVIAVADTELAPLRARVAELEAEVAELRARAAENRADIEGWKTTAREMGETWEIERDRVEFHRARAERAEAALARVEALDQGHSNPACRFPDVDCICSVPLFDLRAALAAAGPAVSDGDHYAWQDRAEAQLRADLSDGVSTTSEAPYPGYRDRAEYDRVGRELRDAPDVADPQRSEAEWDGRADLRSVPASPVVAPSATDEGGA